MKRHLPIIVLLCIFFALTCSSPGALAQDMRLLSIETQKKEAAMKEKAAMELTAARAEAAQSRQKITTDRKRLNHAIAELTRKKQDLQNRIKALSAENTALDKTDAQLAKTLESALGMVKELSGVVRMNAKDIKSVVDSSPIAGVFHPDTGFLKEIADAAVFPGMDHIRKMADLLFDQIRRGGNVSVETCPIVDRSGKAAETQVLLVGEFTAAYRLADETGFLNYSPGERKLFALSRLPDRGMQAKITQYMDGLREAVPMDISRGGALSQLTHQLSFKEQIPKGGALVWPILAILAAGGLIVLERIIFFLRRKIRLEKAVSTIEAAADARKWNDCTAICDKYARNPVIRVIRAGIGSRTLPREDMENAVQEAILKEIPPMERFLSTMGMLAAIAPLLGLLGTVTGMIDTFHVITMHGTGDPRMMSGGISEALVTTMLGLSVAIPIMLAHTLLSRSVESTLGLMEEKAVALINIVQKHQGA
ncbi:MAG: MotA/TolQ/ExbB proton channel family protein [Desulfobacter sp.]|nr:MAG: MotA/TolQ/ExbB proton channel family protein [Desulfobacter sp.]